MKLILQKSFYSKMKRRIEGYQFEVGILEDKAHRLPKSNFMGKDQGTFAGGPVRKMERITGPLSQKEVFKQVQENTGIDILGAPFKSRSTQIIRFTRAFLQGVFGKPNDKRVINLLQSVVRTPILKGQYGSNTARTADAKGFDRLLIDTGQTFRAIKAKITRKPRR
jgi:hypothetical protein